MLLRQDQLICKGDLNLYGGACISQTNPPPTCNRLAVGDWNMSHHKYREILRENFYWGKSNRKYGEILRENSYGLNLIKSMKKL